MHQHGGAITVAVTLERLAKDSGIRLEDVIKEIDRRAVILRWMQKKGMRNFRELSPILERYVSIRDEVFGIAVSELVAQGETMPEILAERSGGEREP